MLAEFLGEQTFVQDNQSRSKRGTLRGIHYQLRNSQAKLVRVVSGSVLDVAVDLRASSPSFGQWVAVELSADNFRQLWIPEGFGHAFYVKSQYADLVYKTTDYYSPDDSRAIRWDDPDLAINWEFDGQPILSAADAAAPLLTSTEVFD